MCGCGSFKFHSVIFHSVNVPSCIYPFSCWRAVGVLAVVGFFFCCFLPFIHCCYEYSYTRLLEHTCKTCSWIFAQEGNCQVLRYARVQFYKKMIHCFPKWLWIYIPASYEQETHCSSPALTVKPDVLTVTTDCIEIGTTSRRDLDLCFPDYWWCRSLIPSWDFQPRFLFFYMHFQVFTHFFFWFIVLYWFAEAV